MLDANAIERTSHRLADAFVTGRPLDGHEALGDDAPTGVREAYEIQRRMREVAGIDVGAWKVGATSEAAQGLLGVDAPFLGGVSASRIVPSGTEFVLTDWFAGSPAIEVEVGLRVTATIAELPGDPLELADVVDVVPCIEVVDSRYGAIIGPPGPCLVADNGVASALVVGESLALDADAIRRLEELAVELVVDDRDPVEGVASMALGHPLAALHVAAGIAIGLGVPIEAGQFVSTGTCTGLTPVMPGMSAAGRVGHAPITATFV